MIGRPPRWYVVTERSADRFDTPSWLTEPRGVDGPYHIREAIEIARRHDDYAHVVSTDGTRLPDERVQR